MRRTPVWRIAAAFLVLAALAFFVLRLAPVYLSNWRLGQYLSSLTSSNSASASSDSELRSRVVSKASEVGLPIGEDNVRIDRSREGLRLQVRYEVRVDFPGYTVTLHFYPQSGGR